MNDGEILYRGYRLTNTVGDKIAVWYGNDVVDMVDSYPEGQALIDSWVNYAA